MIYFIKDTVSQAIKIGYSKKPKSRLGELQTGNPHKLIIVGTVKGTEADEHSFHGKFAEHRLEGEWFKGVIIEEVLTIIAERKANTLEIRRRTVSEESISIITTEGASVPESTGTEKDVMDKDSGIRGVCRIPGVRMKSFSLKLTESVYEPDKKQKMCGVEIKYLLVFEKDFTADEAGITELRNLKGSLFSQDRGIVHRFYDEDNAIIPFYFTHGQPNLCDSTFYHIIGGQEAITGAVGDAFRVMVAFEKALDPNYHGVKIKDVFMGANYTGEHPLKKAKKMIVFLRIA